MKSRKVKVAISTLAVFAVLFALPAQAHAGYLDPGSGSLLVQGILGVMAFFGRITTKIKRLFGIEGGDDE